MPETSQDIRRKVNDKINAAQTAVVRHQESRPREEAEPVRTDQAEKETIISHKEEEYDPSKLNSLETIVKHEEAQKREEEAKKIAKGNRDSTYHDGFEKNKGPIFEQADIIDYMFKQLLKGADWLVNKGLDGIGWVGYSAVNYIGDSYGDWKNFIKSQKEQRNSETRKFAQELETLHKKHLAKRQQEIDSESFRRFIKNLSAEFQNGNIELVKNKTELYQALAQTPPKTLKKLFSPENAASLAERTVTQALLREQFISTYAAARMAAEKAADPKAFRDADIETGFKIKRKEALEVYDKIFRHAEKEQNPQLLKDALDLSRKALQKEMKGISDGQFKENKNTPLPNDHLKTLEAMAAKGGSSSEYPLSLNNPANFINQFTGFDKTEIDALNARAEEHRRHREAAHNRHETGADRRSQTENRQTPMPSRSEGR